MERLHAFDGSRGGGAARSRRRRELLLYVQPAFSVEDIAEVSATLRGGWVVTGPRVRALEEAFRRYHAVPYATATNSGAAALTLALAAAGVGRGDEVILPALAPAELAHCVVHLGAVPVFADVDLRTFAIDPQEVRLRRTERTRAVIALQLGGAPSRTQELREATGGALLIGEASAALETRVCEVPSGRLADIAIFSFHAAGSLPAGDGGMVLTCREEWAKAMRVLCQNGLDRDAWTRFGAGGAPACEVLAAGYAHAMSDLTAALALRQSPRLEPRRLVRARIWARYDDAFRTLPGWIGPEVARPGVRHARSCYTVLVDPGTYRGGRDAFAIGLREENIGTEVPYLCLPKSRFYQGHCGHRAGDFPRAEWVGCRILALPLSAAMGPDDVEDVVRAVYRVAATLAARS
ncbi:MAG: DegT/DnrJ/EryC1/StrS family aminotransferase [Cyanobacteria bacterium REEB65]|nr:DegT/DnrJ/EryC1/StrS family aminotransferase [Cyanobacteria bacterium REEB65]